jgi:hypothetical protein
MESAALGKADGSFTGSFAASPGRGRGFRIGRQVDMRPASRLEPLGHDAGKELLNGPVVQHRRRTLRLKTQVDPDGVALGSPD